MDRYEAATKEFFQQCTYGTELVERGQRPAYRINATDELASAVFYVPDDFTSLSELHVVCIAQDTLTPMTVKVAMSAAADGEDKDTHFTVETQVSHNVTNDYVHEIDVSALDPGMAAGDYVGVRIVRRAAENTNADFLGVHVKYT